MNPDAIAETNWQLYPQDPTVWTLELALRPAKEPAIATLSTHQRSIFSRKLLNCAVLSLVLSMKLQVRLEPSDEGGYTVFVPSLPDCISEGEDIDDALANIQEAIELYLETVDESKDLADMRGYLLRK